jgi:hypothetical protein
LTGNVTNTGELRKAYMILMGRAKRKEHLRDLNEDGQIMLKC